MLPSELLERTWVNHVPLPNTEENCLVSAFAYFNLYWEEGEPILQTLTGELFPYKWNDCHTKEEVIAVARLAEMKLGLREVETEGEERASVVVAHSLVS